MIDAHHHFWRYDAAQYGWIGDDMAPLRRDFLPADLKIELENAGVRGAIAVQARQTLEETNWLLDLADQNSWTLGVVGWVPLSSPQIERVLDELSSRTKFVAVRHVVQHEAAGWMDGAAFNAGIAALKTFDLVYDLLIFERQLGEAIRLVDRHPDQIFVLDHIAKPRIKEEAFQPWQTQIQELARRDNVVCKVSGLVTEADWHGWTPAALKPYFEVVLEAFGPNRLMFGSDWPVCLAACDYARWAQTVRDWATPLSPQERQALFETTARRFYRLA